MALTSKDLQAIEQIVDKTVDKKLEPIKSDLKSFRNKFEKFEIKATKELKYLRKTANTTIEYLETEDTKIKKRVSRLEDIHSLPPLN